MPTTAVTTGSRNKGSLRRSQRWWRRTLRLHARLWRAGGRIIGFEDATYRLETQNGEAGPMSVAMEGSGIAP